jgi:hypothetical protein
VTDHDELLARFDAYHEDGATSVLEVQLAAALRAALAARPELALWSAIEKAIEAFDDHWGGDTAEYLEPDWRNVLTRCLAVELAAEESAAPLQAEVEDLLAQCARGHRPSAEMFEFRLRRWYMHEHPEAVLADFDVPVAGSATPEEGP